MVLYAVPAFGERITPKARNVDRTQLTIKSADSMTKTPISEGRPASVVGVAYSNMAFGDPYTLAGFCSGGCIYDDYDSVIDKPFVQGNFSFVGGVNATGVMWITFFDSLGSFVTSGGWYFNPGLYIYTQDFTGAPATDAGIVQFYPDPGFFAATQGGVFEDTVGPEIGTSNPTFGSHAPGGALMIELNSIELGRCCAPLTGDCTYGPSAACGGNFTASGDPDVCTNDPCPAGTCGNGSIDEGEECDDGNTDPGDGCDALCREEVVYIPAVSEWGLLVMALIGLTVGTVLFGRRRAMA